LRQLRVRRRSDACVCIVDDADALFVICCYCLNSTLD
jgi:hypothetical protein